MNKMPLEQFYAENDKLIHFAALKALKRFKGAGLGDHIEYEEVHGRLTEVFVKSYHGYDPEKATFSTYFVRAATNTITNMIESMYRLEIHTDSATGLGAYDTDDGERDRQDELFHFDAMIEEHVELEDTIDNLRQELSPFASLLLEYSINPPDFIYQEFLSQREQSKYASSIGIKTHHSMSLNLRFIANCLRGTVDTPSEMNFIKSAVLEVERAVKNAVRS